MNGCTPIDIDVATPVSSDNQKRAEVEAFVRLHGMSLEAACDLVVISQDDYLKSPPSHQSRIHHLPTPADIERLTEEIRDNRGHLPDPEFDLRGEDESDTEDESLWH